jgi:hypothetical protein
LCAERQSYATRTFRDIGDRLATVHSVELVFGTESPGFSDAVLSASQQGYHQAPPDSLLLGLTKDFVQLELSVLLWLQWLTDFLSEFLA